MEYSVCLVDEKGQESYLSVKGRTTWKTKRIAIRHANDIRELIRRGKFPAVTADVENEHGELIKEGR